MKNLKTKHKTNKGITLIALVITIIVLLILAAVSIATLTGENGILTKATDSKNKNTEGQEKEQIQLAYDAVMADNYEKGDYVSGVTAEKLQTEIDKQNAKATATGKAGSSLITVEFTDSNNSYEVDGKTGEITGPKKGKEETTITMEEAKKKEKFETKTNVKAEDDKIFTVPAEFKIAEDSAETVEEGVVIEDTRNGLTKGSQFVWIPVDSEDDYVENESYELTSLPRMPGFSHDCNPIIDAHGFYVSRFEAGREGSSEPYTLVSKKDATVWNNIKQSECIEEAKKFIQNSDVKSSLMASIEWDVIMNFVNGKSDGGETSNIFNVTEAEDSRHTGNPANSGENPSDKVCNIFDLEGNYYEYMDSNWGGNGTTGYAQAQFFRGGNYESKDPSPASFYSMNVEDIPDSVLDDISFRFILYII